MLLAFCLLSCLLMIRSSEQELAFLHGVDELRSGYDAMKMLSAAEQRSRYRIFDLSEKSATPFVLKVNGKESSYATPTFAQPTEVSTRKENNCETVSYSFEQFYRSYFQSNSFGIGLPGPKGIALGLEYHDTLKHVHEAITKNSQVVGTSSIWWGLYSIQLAPSFLKFDPMFNASVTLLLTRAANPTSDAEQHFYNEFIRAYGTHYISNVIVGGTAHLYSFVGDNFHKASSYEETSQQISLTAMYQGITWQTRMQTEEVSERITETFRKNSNTRLIFQPPVESVGDQPIVTTWLNKAGEQPVVVNRTLGDITSLISSNQGVQRHLRRTIDFYLANGALPTFDQLNSGANTARSLSLPSKPVGLIGGLDVVGCGYDILTLESRMCVVDTANMSENERWTDPYNHNLSYAVPNGFFATNTPEGLIVNATVMITSVEDYHRTTTRVDIWERHGFGYKKRVEKPTTEFYRRFYQDYYKLALSLRQIGWYTLSTSIFPYPKLTSVAEKAFAKIPSTFNADEMTFWHDFLASFGTHLVVSSQMGGQVWAETWYEKCLNFEHTEVWVDEQVTRTFAGIFTSDSDEQRKTRQVDERFKQHSIYSSQLLGGIETITPEKWEEWTPTVKENPRPISFRLVSLDELLPAGKQRSALRAAIEHVTKQAEIEDREYIAALQAQRGPPPSECSRNQVRRAATAEKNVPTDPEETDLYKLCPYVGYNGRTCAVTSNRAAPMSIYRQLPVGVGMTIDITTGTLLLPAIDFFHDNNTPSVDPFTSATYYHPREVSVIPTNEADNQPIARVFLSAGELANHWKYGPARGEWLGGEFGHSKSMLELQARFFKDEQAIAITQKPYPLHRLKIEVLKLNAYVENAIKALPKLYDEVKYADFLRNWGTHVVMKTLVGGMHEQQVLFKDCVFSFNGAITHENLDEYLKQDILAQTLGNSFYAERRKVSVDHKLGGDPALSDLTQWQRSLGANPALLKIEEFTPWNELVSDPDVKGNLERLINDRVAAHEQMRVQEEAQLITQRANANILSLKGSVGLVENSICQVTSPAVFGSVANCSNGCDTGLYIKATAEASTNDRPLRYFRDPSTGFVQARVRLLSGDVSEGVRVSVGCSIVSSPTMLTRIAYVCVGCTLASIVNDACTCVCPAYPAPLTTTTTAST